MAMARSGASPISASFVPVLARPTRGLSAQGMSSPLRQMCTARFGVDKPANNGDNLRYHRLLACTAGPRLTASRHQIVLMAAIAGCVAFSSSQAAAQWWSRGPADFEECADI